MNRRKIALWQAGGLLLTLGTLTHLALSAPDARAQASTILGQLAKWPETQRVASESIAKSQDALKRAEQMRASGDQAHGAMLEETALEWAKASELLGKTANAEKQLLAAQTLTTQLETKVFRAQALVEQSVARRARAEEALRKLEEKGVKP